MALVLGRYNVSFEDFGWDGLYDQNVESVSF